MIDDGWCEPESDRRPNTIKHWLLADDRFTYLRHLFSGEAVGQAWLRLLYGLGYLPLEGPVDGFRDFEQERTWDIGNVRRMIATTTPARIRRGRYPAVPRLQEFVTTLPAESGLVLLVPPVYESRIPAPGSEEDLSRRDCMDALQAVLRGRPRSSFINRRVRSDITEKIENFWDAIHYRGTVARLLESDIVAALAQWR